MRKIILGIILGLIIFVLTGCGKTISESNGSSSNTTTEVPDNITTPITGGLHLKGTTYQDQTISRVSGGIHLTNGATLKNVTIARVSAGLHATNSTIENVTIAALTGGVRITNSTVKKILLLPAQPVV
ncbi:MAG: DUF4097 domain-containing protein [Candidatus Margulisbacteria bacterium]|jgi:hypothetical protein|nr:DUF4097 domain-containing protein [Candidatus Margulisiibacteriota bacterium]